MTMKLDESLFTVPGVGRGLRFYVTGATPCPYLDGQMERKAFTHLNQASPDALHNQLSEAGFRRSQSVAYRPSCAGCTACISVRVVAEGTGTGAIVRVVIESSDGHDTWSTMGSSENILEASWLALADCMEYWLVHHVANGGNRA